MDTESCEFSVCVSKMKKLLISMRNERRINEKGRGKQQKVCMYDVI